MFEEDNLILPYLALGGRGFIVLKNNKGVEENRVRHLDYGVQFNKLMYTRLIKNEEITLFSPSDVPGLYDAFFADQELFKLYVQYEDDPSIKKKIKAIELFVFLLKREQVQVECIFKMLIIVIRIVHSTQKLHQ